MASKLVVVRPFDGFKRGDVIKDEATIKRVLSEGRAASVVQVMAGS